MPAHVVNGILIWCHERGRTGPTIILLHPGPGSDGSVFFPWFDELATDHAIVAPDLPGHGRSDDGDRANWNLSGYARFVHDFAEARGISDYTILGHSFGSWVALTHAIEYPGEAARVIASCGAAWLEGDVLAGLEARMNALQPEHVRRDVIDAFEREDQVQSVDEYRDVWVREAPFFVADPLGPAADALRSAFAEVVYRPTLAAHQEWGAFDLREALRSVDVPVLAITGACDRSTPPDAGRHIARLAPRGTFVEIADAAHFPYLENPNAFFTAIRAWLRRST